MTTFADGSSSSSSTGWMQWDYTYSDQSVIGADGAVTRDQSFVQTVQGGGGGTWQSSAADSGGTADSSWSSASESIGSGSGTIHEVVQWTAHTVQRGGPSGQTVLVGSVSSSAVDGGSAGFSTTTTSHSDSYWRAGTDYEHTTASSQTTTAGGASSSAEARWTLTYNADGTTTRTGSPTPSGSGSASAATASYAIETSTGVINGVFFSHTSSSSGFAAWSETNPEPGFPADGRRGRRC